MAASETADDGQSDSLRGRFSERVEETKESVAEDASYVGSWYDAAKERGELEAQGFREDERAQLGGGRLFSLVSGAVVLGLTIIVLLLMILISGEFADSIDNSGAFSNASNSTETNGETAFDIMSVSTLVVPVIVVVGLLVGAFMSGRGGIGR